MAEVTFFGFGATGFPDPDVEILPANLPSEAEVQFEGFGATAVGELSTLVEIFSPTLTANPEFTQVDFFENPDTDPPLSENPNDNVLIYVVAGGPDSGSQAINVLIVPAPKFVEDEFIDRPPTVIDLRLYRGVLSPSGVAGKVATFLRPTGVSGAVAPGQNIRGVTGLIGQIGEPTGPNAGAVNSIIFENPLPVQPTNGDRFVIDSDDRSLRRTPLIEVILE